MDVERYAREYRRKQRRESILLITLGIVFAAAGAFICMIGSWWFGLAGIAFGVMCVAGGTSMQRPDGSPAARLWGIVSCSAFALMGALMIITAIVDPAAFGWRGGLAGIIAGVLCLGFFGPGAVILISREIKRRNQAS